MKLTDAFKTIGKPYSQSSYPVEIYIACGFTPLHLETFLAAHLRCSDPNATPSLKSGLFEDLLGNIKRLSESNSKSGVIIIEWADLDQRLGIRHLGGWAREDINDIVSRVEAKVYALETAILDSPINCSLVVCTPTLPIPPISHSPKSQIDFLKSHLSATIAGLVGQSIIKCLFPPIPKKGIIIDLDDTLWRGTLGEDGVSDISWDLDNHSHNHGLFQQFLSSLADSGILIGVATRNDPDLVQEAFQRPDLIINKDILFPIEASWGRKSLSISKILDTWNISDDSVIFIDDSPLELAEVQSYFPNIECLQYPTNNNQAAYNLIIELREKFAKESISLEDGLRLTSIKANAKHFSGTDHPSPTSDAFLQEVEAQISFSFSKILSNNREFDLVNKTNQFNLNGQRISKTNWDTMLDDPNEYLLTVMYQDKFGPLGKIAVLTGRVDEQSLLIQSWVMSCRAFNRNIEYTCLDILFKRYNVNEIRLKYQVTEKNQPIQELIHLYTERSDDDYVVLKHAKFMAKSPILFHKTSEINHE